jgi:hypothetical protein
MSAKKAGRQRSTEPRAALRRESSTVVVAAGDEEELLTVLGSTRHPRPAYINPESPEDRERRLAARKERTIKAFQMTYENRRRKKR